MSSTVTTFLVTGDNQPTGVVRGHGSFILNVNNLPDVDRTTNYTATITEVAVGPTGVYDLPFIGAASMNNP
jgi:hypothetical protein